MGAITKMCTHKLLAAVDHDGLRDKLAAELLDLAGE
jgi:hypothetical protein